MRVLGTLDIIFLCSQTFNLYVHNYVLLLQARPLLFLHWAGKIFTLGQIVFFS